ncbi:rhodanese-like domain-containing protein [Pragia fontium]|uniref:Rhodanese-related sulfurtransferase n=2 Tax=Pragia fontium TaxID=82985 RepID=A0AAJ4WBT0_9GAMM|nr:rhodanese-like domain-containing protein [Pragia fontium]AKJ42993.1 sulfurtransferase [Pragia fontium]SFD07904.1 Rhodanese-related sulfurtransferase [Pragia fontium DSM 5563 = ATCC 49100]SUB83420.1 Thiosulfate sulfurtransferase glpE [Pragia fontium]VEJ56313.1 Thiosulfate sulfurtransferase glpE [Pragia fontium]GKX63998.1 sulfurtransferase [Pragia fontium]
MKKHNPGFEQLCEAARKNVHEVSIQQVKEMMDNGSIPLVIDVREESEFAKDHLPEAKHIGRGVLERDIETHVPDKKTPMVLYCGGGYRSALAAESIQKMGYTAVLSMDGGYRSWNEANFPLVKK